MLAHDIRVGWNMSRLKRWSIAAAPGLGAIISSTVMALTRSRRTSIRLEADSHGPNGWCFGVSSPMSVKDMSDNDRERRSFRNRTLARWMICFSIEQAKGTRRKIEPAV